MRTLLAVMVLVLGCGDDDAMMTGVDGGPGVDGGGGDGGGGDGGGGDAGGTVRLRGGVQKGPFVLGSSLAISPIDGVGNPTGEVFNTMTFNDLGEFAVEFSYLGPVSLEAEGFYYNEATGMLSGAPITLRAYHEVNSGGAQSAYLNLITHLTYGRIRQLVLEGMPLTDATTQAETELRLNLGIGPMGFDPGAPGITLNVLGGDNDANAYLLAVSAVLSQAGVTRGGDAGLQELLNVISTDLGTDGSLSVDIKAEINAAHRAVDADEVMLDLEARLMMLGSEMEVPNIHRMLDTDGDSFLNIDDRCPTVVDPAQIDTDGDGAGDECDVEQLSGEDHVCAVMTVGTARCWRDDIRTPIEAPFTGVQRLAAIVEVCAVVAGGAVECWAPLTPAIPARTITGVTGAVGIAALRAPNTICAWSPTTIWCWPDNAMPLATAPATTTMLTNVVSHGRHCDVRSPGAVTCTATVPGLGGVTDATEVECEGSTCCVRRAGEVSCSWSTPPPIFAAPATMGETRHYPFTAPTAMDLAGFVMCGVTGGQLHCIGRGALPDGTEVTYAAPTLIAGVSDVADVALTLNKACVRTTDGNAHCWTIGTAIRSLF